MVGLCTDVFGVEFAVAFVGSLADFWQNSNKPYRLQMAANPVLLKLSAIIKTVTPALFGGKRRSPDRPSLLPSPSSKSLELLALKNAIE